MDHRGPRHIRQTLFAFLAFIPVLAIGQISETRKERRELPIDIRSSKVLVAVSSLQFLKPTIIPEISKMLSEMGLDVDTIMELRMNPTLKEKDLAVMRERHKQGQFTLQLMAGPFIILQKGYSGTGLNPVKYYLSIHRPTEVTDLVPEKGSTLIKGENHIQLFSELSTLLNTK